MALDCLFHQNPLKPSDKGYNKSCPCPGPMTVTNPDGCTCMSGCALEGCPSNAACGGGRVCNMRSAQQPPYLPGSRTAEWRGALLAGQFHVCLYPWDTQACGQGIERLTDAEFEGIRLPGVLHMILD